MFLVSGPELVIAQCRAGIVGSFPALNARPAAALDDWLMTITEALAAWDDAHPEAPSAPYAVNLIVNRTNARLDEDLATCVRWNVPLVITSLGARPEIFEAVHAYGGLVLHDVINDRFARKAIEKGADGLIAVAAGAGGHAGDQSPFALMQEIRAWFDGPLALSGAIGNGRSVLAAQALGADFAYCGSLFIAAEESMASEAYRSMVVDANADDIVSSALFSGIRANYLKASIRAAGLDPDALPAPTASGLIQGEARPWRDIHGCGQGVGPITQTRPVSEIVHMLAAEWRQARMALRTR
jgi:nitronate monooxygenase